jgi:hypothetical protein
MHSCFALSQGKPENSKCIGVPFSPPPSQPLALEVLTRVMVTFPKMRLSEKSWGRSAVTAMHKSVEASTTAILRTKFSYSNNDPGNFLCFFDSLGKENRSHQPHPYIDPSIDPYFRHANPPRITWTTMCLARIPSVTLDNDRYKRGKGGGNIF